MKTKTLFLAAAFSAVASALAAQQPSLRAPVTPAAPVSAVAADTSAAPANGPRVRAELPAVAFAAADAAPAARRAPHTLTVSTLVLVLLVVLVVLLVT
jgi:hypothetical protein